MAWLRKDRIWPTAITVILLGNVALGFFLVRVAGNDEHFAVEPDYYRKAVAWDATMVAAERSAALGWSVVPQIGALIGDAPVAVTFIVRDRDGMPVEGADVDVEALSVAYANAVVRSRLAAATEVGSYAGALRLAPSGLWEFRIRVAQGSAIFTTSLRMDLSDRAPATLVTARPGDPLP